MKIIKFRIKNYKSIIDTGDCYLSDKLTILAGKNESGKSSILEALEDFNHVKTISDMAKPINKEGIPEISIKFRISATDINEIFREIKSTKTVSEDLELNLTKKFNLNTYLLDEDSKILLDNSNILDETKNQIIEYIDKIEKSIIKSEMDIKFPKFITQKLKDYKTEVVTFRQLNIFSIDTVAEIENFEKVIDNFCDYEKLATDFTNEMVKTKLPNFILFSSFDDKFPKEIDISSLSQNEWAKYLQNVSNFSIEKMNSKNQQELVNHENSVNVEFSQKFNKYWTQDKITLQIKKDGLKLNFWIVENNKLYYPSQRSKGQQWYLSFYLKIVSKLQENKSSIILIDEPGLYLHAKAQKDLLQVLNEHTKENPVVFTTHSPYLITVDNLENIRLIEKTDEGTKIYCKIHAISSADKDSLTPILTAIGLGINDSITNLGQKNNVIVEGAEDVFYLQAFKEILKKDLNTNFINGGGSSNMCYVGTILAGWGANIFYLFDNDQGKKDGEKKLKKWDILPEKIKTVLQKNNSTIVDIFNKEDFKNYILGDIDIKYDCSNSEYVKNNDNKIDKVLFARKFLQKAKKEEISLSEETKNNVLNLFNEIEFK